LATENEPDLERQAGQPCVRCVSATYVAFWITEEEKVPLCPECVAWVEERAENQAVLLAAVEATRTRQRRAQAIHSSTETRSIEVTPAGKASPRLLTVTISFVSSNQSFKRATSSPLNSLSVRRC
jgi:hypothetical protein